MPDELSATVVDEYNPEDHKHIEMVKQMVFYDEDDYKALRPNMLEAALVWLTHYSQPQDADDPFYDTSQDAFRYDDLETQIGEFFAHCYDEWVEFPGGKTVRERFYLFMIPNCNVFFFRCYTLADLPKVVQIRCDERLASGADRCDPQYYEHMPWAEMATKRWEINVHYVAMGFIGSRNVYVFRVWDLTNQD